jgi:hypothetical protein
MGKSYDVIDVIDMVGEPRDIILISTMI